MAVQGGGVAAALRAQLDPADVADADQAAALPVVGLDDDVLEIRRVVQAPGDVDRVLEVQAVRGRRHADHAGGDLLALLLDRADHVGRHQPIGLQLVRVQPDPHGIGAGAVDGDVADAGQPGQLLLQADDAVIRQEQPVIAVVRRRQGDELQDRGRLLLHVDALHLHRLRQGRQGDRHPVLHQHLGEIGVRADVEGDGEVVGAVAGAGRLHVQHALDAVDLLLDRQGDRVHHRPGAGAGIGRGDLHRRRHHVLDTATPAAAAARWRRSGR